MTEKQKLVKMDELYETAVSRYLDKTDFSLWDWLCKEDIQEYEKLQKETGPAE